MAILLQRIEKRSFADAEPLFHSSRKRDTFRPLIGVLYPNLPQADQFIRYRAERMRQEKISAVRVETGGDQSHSSRRLDFEELLHLPNQKALWFARRYCRPRNGSGIVEMKDELHATVRQKFFPAAGHREAGRLPATRWIPQMEPEQRESHIRESAGQ